MKIIGKVTKTTEEKLVFGWASVVQNNDAPVIDRDGDMIPIGELERAAYNFVQFGGACGEMHSAFGGGVLVESMVFTPQKLQLLGVEGVPCGWWVGFKITDDALWQKIKSGTYTMFSIGGRATREEITDEKTD